MAKNDLAFGNEDVQKMIASLVDLRDETGRFMEGYKNTFLNNSQASRKDFNHD